MGCPLRSWWQGSKHSAHSPRVKRRLRPHILGAGTGCSGVLTCRQLFLPHQGCLGLLRLPHHIPGAQIQGAASGSLSKKKIRVLSLSVNPILWGQKSQPQCWWKPHPAPLLMASQGIVQHWAAALRQRAGGKRTLPAALKLLGWFCAGNTLKATHGPTAEVPVMLPGGLPHWDTPSAAREITLYTIATIYLWYVLIYNIHCVR